MRVLIAHNRYRTAGGEEHHVDLLEAGLQQAGHTVRRFERSSGGERRLPKSFVSGALMAYNPISGHAFARELDAFRPDVVHAHNLLPLLTPSVLHEAKRRSIRTVLTAHNYRLICPGGTLLRRGQLHDDCVQGSSFICGLRGSRSPWLESLAYGFAIELQRRLRLVARWTDVIVAPTKALRDVLVAAGYRRDKIVVVPNGVHIPDWEPREREYVLYAGRLSEEKGLRTLLSAAERVAFPLVVAGDGPLVHELVISPTNVHYLGWLTGTRLQAVRRRAAAAVVPSESPDVMPFAVTEALAAGVPVIVTNMGGLPELVENGAGSVVPAHDPDALASAMTRAWEESKKNPDFGRDAVEAAKRRFSLNRQIDRLVALYQGKDR